MSNSFFSDLAPLKDFANFHLRTFYQPLPHDWGLALVDISGSTQAIAAGHYRWVNALGVAALAALRNALAPLEIPYQFGGDGATVAIPLQSLPQAKQALRLAKALASERFGLDLRIGVIGMGELHSLALEVLVAKYQPDPSIPPQALFMGQGVAAAEKMLKDTKSRGRYDLEQSVVGAEPVVENAFAGFECRWQPVPSQYGEIVSLIVVALDTNGVEGSRLLAQILEKVREIYRVAKGEQPFAKGNLRVATASRDLAIETKIRMFGATGLRAALYQFWLTLICLLARPIFKNGWRLPGGADPITYQSELMARTDFQKFDGSLRILLDGTRAMREELTKYLEAFEANQLVRYGLHVSESVVITCLVEDRNQRHFHFVDGGNGGYTAAARQLKSKQSGQIDS